MDIAEIAAMLKGMFRFVTADASGDIRATVIPRTGPQASLLQLDGQNGEIAVATDVAALVVQFPAAAGGTQAISTGASAADITRGIVGRFADGGLNYAYPAAGNSVYPSLPDLCAYLRKCTYAPTASVNILLGQGSYGLLDTTGLPNVNFFGADPASVTLTGVASISGDPRYQTLTFTYSGANPAAATGCVLCIDGSTATDDNVRKCTGSFPLVQDVDTVNKRIAVTSITGAPPAVGPWSAPQAATIIRSGVENTYLGANSAGIGNFDLGYVYAFQRADGILYYANACSSWFSQGTTIFGDVSSSLYCRGTLTLDMNSQVFVGFLGACANDDYLYCLYIDHGSRITAMRLAAVGVETSPQMFAGSGTELTCDRAFIGYGAVGVMVGPGARAILGTLTTASLTHSAVDGNDTPIALNALQPNMSCVQG